MSGNGLNTRNVWFHVCHVVIILRYSEVQFAKPFPKDERLQYS